MLAKPIAIAALLFLASCVQPHPKRYAIRDFRDSLQPWLVSAVDAGAIGYDTGYRFIKAHASDSEIVQLSQAENPMLRAIALEEMTHRPNFNHAYVMMTHLYDTAFIMELIGETGERFITVTDRMILWGRWTTDSARNTLADSVVLHHDNLLSAYTALAFLPVTSKYYSHIRQMALRNRAYNGEVDYALIALAKYRRKADIPVILQLLQENRYRLSEVEFRLMQDYPDTAYLNLILSWYPRRYDEAVCNRQIFDLVPAYYNCLASYRTAQTAQLLTSIYNRKPFAPRSVDTSFLQYELRQAIWQNPCPAYSRLRSLIRAKVMQDSANTFDLDTAQLYKDTSTEPVRWMP